MWPRVGEDHDRPGAATPGFYHSIHHSAAVVGANTTALIDAAIIGRRTYSILLPELKGAQEQTLHFHYLLPENGGALVVAGSLGEPSASCATCSRARRATRAGVRSSSAASCARMASTGRSRRCWSRTSSASWRLPRAGCGMKGRSGDFEAFFRTDGESGPLIVVYHVQKTAGTSLRRVVRANLPPSEVETQPYLHKEAKTPQELLAWHERWYRSLDDERRALACAA